MANNNAYNSSGDLRIGDNTYESNDVNLNWSFTSTGSGMVVSDTQTISSGSWQGLTFTQSMVNGLYVTHIRNSGPSASVKLAGSSTGGGINPVIGVGGWDQITFVGNVNQPLYAQSMTSGSSSVLRCSGMEF
jgi:hypothetical protein